MAKAAKTSASRASRAAAKSAPAVEAQLNDALRLLERASSKAVRQGMARYAIPADNAIGVSVGNLRAIARKLGRNHDLAQALWVNGLYEARMLACFVDDPAQLTPAQMDRWCRDFDSWAICDTACFALFDRSPHAWKKVPAWSRRREEFAKRAAFALLASLCLHDKRADDAPFLDGLALIEAAAGDERNFVMKAVNWALRSIGRRNRALNAASIDVARRLAQSAGAPQRWVGKGALRELAGPSVVRRLAAKTK